MASPASKSEPLLEEVEETQSSSSLDEEVDEDPIEAWDDWESEGSESPSEFLCLFCSSRFDSSVKLFEHCDSDHSFNFHGIVEEAGLDFYGSMKLINYVRSQLTGHGNMIRRGLATKFKKLY